MNAFLIQSATRTPYIHFDPVTGKFEMKGKSVPEDTSFFYKPVMEWLDEYLKHPAKTTALNIQLDYFNTSSAKYLVDIFRRIEQIGKQNKGEVMINWLYNELDIEMMESGEGYKSILKLNFNLIPFKA